MVRFERMRLPVLLLAALSPLGRALSQGLPPMNNPAADAAMAATANTAALTPTALTQPAIFLKGRVLLENGSPPPSPAKIERICNSVAHSEGFTDAQGFFGIQFGSNASSSQGADEQDRLAPSVTAPIQVTPSLGDPAGASLTSDRRLLDCELRAVLSGYHSQTVPIRPLHLMENPDIGVIVMRPNGSHEDSGTVTAQSLAVPKPARRLFERAQAEAKAKKADLAQQHLKEAIAVYPEYAAAWCALGELQEAGADLDSARTSFERAIHGDPNLVDPYLQLATVSVWERKWQEVADLTHKALELDPLEYPQLYLYAAVASFNLRKPQAAERYIERAQALDTQHAFPEIEHMAGVILAGRQEYAAAATHLRAYLKLAPDAGDADSARTRLAEAEKMTAQAPEK